MIDAAGHRQHVAVLLAAGSSRRLGQAKQLLRQNGVALVRRMAECALATAPRELLVITGAETAAVRAALADINARLHHNPDWHSGLASSLQCAARALTAHDGAVLLLGCDQPLLQPTHLLQLLAASNPATGIAISDYGSGAGIPVRVPASLLQQADQLRGDAGFKTLWAMQPVQTVPAPALAFDLDTPADLALAIANGWLDAL